MTHTGKELFTYSMIGIANTLVHWQVFFVFREMFHATHATSNALAFLMAASGSFYLNALFSFAMPASLKRYAVFMMCMGSLSWGIGTVADHWQLPGLLTVAVFSAVSLVIGFALSKWLVFRGDAP
jgi:putative flippase GtrA